MENIASSLKESDLTTTRQRLQGLTSIQGSRIRSGGFPASPEVLFPFVEIKTIEPIIVKGQLLPEDRPATRKWASSIDDIAQSYRADDRDNLANAVNQLTVSIENFKTGPKLHRIPERLKQKVKNALHFK